jgi:hypothetical protein
MARRGQQAWRFANDTAERIEKQSAFPAIDQIA